MKNRPLFVIWLLLALGTHASGQGIDVTAGEVLGTAHPDERIRTAGADRINGLRWIDGSELIVSGHDSASRFVYRTAIGEGEGEKLWEQRFGVRYGSVSISADGEHVLVQGASGAFVPGQEDVDEGDGPEVVAQVLDARTGEAQADILLRDVTRATRRDEDAGVDDIAFGPIDDELIVIFSASEEDLRRAAQRRGEIDFQLFGNHGTRAYRYNWRRKRRVGRPYQTDAQIEFGLSPDGTLLGYVAKLQDVLCVYDAQARRDRVLAGEHVDDSTERAISIDTPFYSGIQISNTHAVVARDAPGGPGAAVLFVINLTNGEVESRIPTPGGHIVFDVDFDHARIAVTGSAKHLGVYDFAGNELYLEEDATAHRNFAIAFSPDGGRLALGGYANTVHVYTIAER